MSSALVFMQIRACISDDSAGWIEFKTEEKLRELSVTMPNRYVQKADGSWSCPPGEAHAGKLGLSYTIETSYTVNHVAHRNAVYLHDYIARDYHEPKKSSVESLIALIQGNQGISLAELRRKISAKLSIDDLNFLISRGTIYTDLERALLVEPDEVKIYSDRSIAEAKAGAPLHFRHDLYQLPELVLRIYRQTVDDVTKTRCLDTMDRMLESGLSSLESELGKVER